MSPNNPVTNKFQSTPRRKKVFDIVPPGKSLASPNSRSVIVSSKPAVEDQQVIHARPDARMSAAPDRDRPLMQTADKIQLSPVSADAPEPVVSSVPVAVTHSAPVGKLDAPDTLPPAPSSAPAVHKPLLLEPPEPTELLPAPKSPGTKLQVQDADEGSAIAVSFGKSKPAPKPAAQPVKSAPVVAVEPSVALAAPVASDADADDDMDAMLAEVFAKPVEPRQDIAAQPEAPPASQPDPLLSFDTDPAPARSQLATDKSAPQKAALPQPAPQPAEPDPQVAPPETPEAASAEMPAKATYRREDLLSGAGMVMPQDEAAQRMIVSHHKQRMHAWQWVMVAVLIIVIALVAVNFLIDAEVIQTDLQLPVTNLL